MNNEKQLYDYIKSHGGFLVARDVDIAKSLGISRNNIPRYKRKLRDNGFIETKIQFLDNKPITVYRITKDYVGQLSWE